MPDSAAAGSGRLWGGRFGGGPAEGGGVLRDDRDAGLQQIGQLDVVEADQGDRAGVLGQHPDHRDRHPVVAGEDRGDRLRPARTNVARAAGKARSF